MSLGEQYHGYCYKLIAANRDSAKGTRMNDQPRPTILTIGHSNHPRAHVVGLLKANGVTAVADVRSSPYSRLHPDFNREPLQKALKSEGFAYVFLGDELGARSRDPACYSDGKVQYRKLAQTELFRRGLDRVLQGAELNRIALLCAERDPLACHRSILVARELEARGAAIEHIHADGTREPHAVALNRLLTLVGLPEADLFRGREELIEDAYTLQEQRIAYVSETLRAEAERVA